MAQNIRLQLEYEGTHYHGWQRQPNAITVQETLENAIKQFTQEQVRVIAAGRTDTGVHARRQIVNFFLEKAVPVSRIPPGINDYLPKDIVVHEAAVVPDDFHARYSAIRRTYHYYILFGKTALYRNFCWQVYYRLDKELLPIMAEKLVGEHDFGAFARFDTGTSHKLCHVYESQWVQEGIFWVYRISANRFLRGMVRSIVGTMIDVARGRFTLEQFQKIFHSRNRIEAGVAAPPCGLFLHSVEYPT
ncbi:MAG: tRNA pseudouridine(38-40) synthase TruA [Calditrichia bacterium]